MRVNWFSPIYPAKTDICRYSDVVVRALAEHCQVVVWTEAESWDPALEAVCEVRRFDPELPIGDMQWHHISMAQASFYNIGNNAQFHGGIWKVSQRHPGFVILHDTLLQDFFAGLFIERRKDPQGYVALMQAFHGDKGQMAARELLEGQRRIDEMRTEFPLTGAALNGALGAVVHNQDAFGVLSQVLPIPLLSLALPYAISRPKTVLKKPGQVVELLVFGFIGANRRLASILDALAGCEQKERFRLRIYGQLDDAPGVQQQIKALELDKQVDIAGFVSFEKLQKALDRADLVFNLRFPTVGEASGSQLRIWEHGKPSLVTPVGWYNMLPLKAVGHVHPDSEQEDIQRHLKQFLENPEPYMQMGVEGRSILEQEHAPESYAQAMVAMTQLAAGCRAQEAGRHVLVGAAEKAAAWSLPYDDTAASAAIGQLRQLIAPQEEPRAALEKQIPSERLHLPKDSQAFWQYMWHTHTPQPSEPPPTVMQPEVGDSAATAAFLPPLNAAPQAAPEPLPQPPTLTFREMLQARPGQLVPAAYRTILGREPDHLGFVHYAGQLSAGTLKPAEFLHLLATSDEAKQNGFKDHQLLPHAGISIAWLKNPWLKPIIRLWRRAFNLPRLLSVLLQTQSEVTLELDQLKRHSAAQRRLIQQQHETMALRTDWLVSALNQTRQTLNQAYASLDQWMHHTETTMADLQQAIVRESKQNQDFVHQMGRQLTQTFNDEHQQIKALFQEQLAEIHIHIEHLKSQENALKADLTSMAQGHHEMASRLNRSEETLRQERTRLDRAEESLRQEATQRESLQQRWQQTNQAYEALAGRVHWTEENGKARQEHIENLRLSTQGLKTNVEQQQAQMQQQQAQMQQHQAQINQYHAQIQQHQTQIEQYQTQIQQHQAKMEQLQGNLNETAKSQHDGKFLALQALKRLDKLPESNSKRPTKAEGDSAQARTQQGEPQHPSQDAIPGRLDVVYSLLEEHFRGPREDIRQRFEVYLPHLKKAEAGGKDRPVFDLGCGRGEFLELLAGRGLHGYGVDLSQQMVTNCQDLGLDVRHGDALEALSAAKPESLGAVTGFHIAEHLPFHQLVMLMEAAFEALKPGGLLILETPNPENVRIATLHFYMDPTHRHPLPPQLLKFTAESCGFFRCHIERLHPWPNAFEPEGAAGHAQQLNELFNGPTDYALIAQNKPVS